MLRAERWLRAQNNTSIVPANFGEGEVRGQRRDQGRIEGLIGMRHCLVAHAPSAGKLVKDQKKIEDDAADALHVRDFRIGNAGRKLMK